MSDLQITRCKLCGGQMQHEGLPIIGEDVRAKHQRFVNGLMQHLAEYHPEQLDSVMQATSLFLVASSFDIADDIIAIAAKEARKFVLNVIRQTREESKPRVTSSGIQQGAS